jgi:hypothetical protein
MARSACTAPEAEGVRQPRGARGGAQTAQVLVPVQYDRSNDKATDDTARSTTYVYTDFARASEYSVLVLTEGSGAVL